MWCAPWIGDCWVSNDRPWLGYCWVSNDRSWMGDCWVSNDRPWIGDCWVSNNIRWIWDCWVSNNRPWILLSQQRQTLNRRLLSQQQQALNRRLLSQTLTRILLSQQRQTRLENEEIIFFWAVGSCVDKYRTAWADSDRSRVGSWGERSSRRTNHCQENTLSSSVTNTMIRRFRNLSKSLSILFVRSKRNDKMLSKSLSILLQWFHDQCSR